MRVLFVAALKEEVQGLLEQAGADVLYTGIGKVNASYALTKALCEARANGGPSSLGDSRGYGIVVNVGTAGSSKFPTHSLVECTKFLQHDIDLRPLGFALGETPYDTIMGAISSTALFSHLPPARCGSGDSFATNGVALECDVVDMEAFAFAKVCAREGVAFHSVKYITDGTDHNAHNDWASNLPRAAASFAELYRGWMG